MKKVKLQKLVFRNFKGLQDYAITFDDVTTTVCGANGTGKSTLFNGFLWLLFGKDALDRKDYEVRTHNADGSLVHEVECSVTGVLDVDGEIITIKRESVEDWVKPRGEVDRVLKGTHNECWWNEAPVKVNEYNDRVAAIIEPSLFKMITNPMFFANMDWKLQRAQLFQLAGTISDAEIAARNPEFALLLDKLTGKSLADFKIELAAKKKRLKKELGEIQPRIDQTAKMMPEAIDFAAIEAEIAGIEAEIAEIDKILSDNATRIRAEYAAEQAKVNEIARLESEREAIVRHARKEADNVAFEANAARRETKTKMASLVKERAIHERSLKTLVASMERDESTIARLEADITKKREEWHQENGKTYSGDDVCFHCGQALPEAMVEKNHAEFIKAQTAKKNAITQAGKELASVLATMKKAHQATEESVTEVKTQIAALTAQITAYENKLRHMDEVKPTTIVPEELDGYAEKTSRIEEIKATLSTQTTQSDDKEYQAKKKSLNVDRDVLKRKLANRDAIAKAETEIANLKESGKQLAQAIATLEREEYVIQEFTRVKIDECESRINALFHNISFRLFDKTFEGNTYETCIPMVNGVPFGSANTAGQVNAGLDIINTLCRFHGICAPIFFDNSESVNEYISTDAQCIFLKVTNDNQLTIE